MRPCDSDRQMKEHDEYRVLTPRRRVLILLLAIATAVTVVLTLLAPPGGSKGPRPVPPPCVEDGVTRCVGGKADVILLPASGAPPSPQPGEQSR